MNIITITIKRFAGLFLVMTTFFLISACDGFLEVPLPDDSLTAESVFDDAGSIEANMTGLFNAYFSAVQGYHIIETGFTSDELYTPNVVNRQLLMRLELLPTDFLLQGAWRNNYKTIYHANSMIEQLSGSTVVSDEQKRVYYAEARFIRAISYFMLVNLFGDVPLVLATNVRENMQLPRTPKVLVYEMILSDLETAVHDLPEEPHPVRGTRSIVAQAFKARVHLYLEQWQQAEVMATEVIDGGIFELESNLNQVFKLGSREVIFGAHQATGRTQVGQDLALMPEFNSTASIQVSDALIGDFEPGDNRRQYWIGETAINEFFPYKYKYGTYVPTVQSSADPEVAVILRLAEQYLIRAEARAMQNKLAEARADLDVVRNRAGLGPSVAATQQEVLSAIEQERRTELFIEGHRWFDLIRTNRADEVLEPYKGSDWKSYVVLFPIPQIELENNPALVQNPGY